MTATMKAINIIEPGGPGVLKVAVQKIPTPSDYEVLIKIEAAGINRPDIMQRKGLYPPPMGASHILGLECAGTVEEIGKNVSSWKVGDKVCALLNGGGYAEHATAHEGCCLPVPNLLSFEEAAALPETFFTVWSNIIDRANLKSGETFLVHGGTSGIGTAAIQIAKAYGAKVITTSGSDEKCDFCRDLGASLAINYKTQDFLKKTLEFTDGKGADVILDIVAGDYMAKNIKALNEDGRLVIIAVQSGPKVELNVLPIMLKRLTVTGSTLRARDNKFKSDIAIALKKNIWPLIEKGKIKPVLDKIFSIDEVQNAHNYLEAGNHIGKVVLKV